MLRQVELDDMGEGGGVDCSSMCFRFKKCTSTCEKITSAMSNSTGYPCIAAGMCPALDEFGEVSCKWSYKSMGCEPASSCVCKHAHVTRLPQPSALLLSRAGRRQLIVAPAPLCDPAPLCSRPHLHSQPLSLSPLSLSPLSLPPSLLASSPLSLPARTLQTSSRRAR